MYVTGTVAPLQGGRIVAPQFRLKGLAGGDGEPLRVFLLGCEARAWTNRSRWTRPTSACKVDVYIINRVQYIWGTETRS